MRGRVTPVLFVLSLLLSDTALANCSLQLQYSVPFRASYFDLSIDANDLWTATGHGVRLFDRTVDAPRLVDSIDLPGVTRIIRAVNGVAYAASGATIHVLRNSGNRIEAVRSLNAPAAINDLLIAGTTLYAATSSGISVYSLANPQQPAPVASTLQTSSPNVRSLAQVGSSIAAADGDATVEVFNGGSLSATLTSTLRATAVTTAGQRLFVSDGQQTEIFLIGSGTNSLATVPFGTLSAASVGTDVVFLAGNDRRYRIVDLSVPGNPIELFSGDIAPTGGTVNRVGNIEVAGPRAYVAGGDGGLLTFDTSSFGAPYPLRIYRLGPETSILATGSAVYAGNANGGITELTRSALSGSLTVARTWAESQPQIVHDTANDFLLTSSGAIATYWTLKSTSPSVISTATFAAPVKSASLVASKTFALLDDGSLWTADLAQAVATPVAALPGPFAFAAATTRGAVVADVRLDGTTQVRFYPNGQFTSEPSVATIEGAATALGMTESRVAVFTFRGISIIDFGAGAPVISVLPSSNTNVVTDIALSSDRLIDVSAAGIRVWNLATRAIIQELSTSSEPIAAAIAPTSEFAAIATGEGVASLNLQTTSRQPRLVGVTGGNSYYRKALATTKNLLLWDGASLEIYSTGSSAAPRHVATINTPGVIDFAVSETALFTLGSTGTITAYGLTGEPLRSVPLNEGTDAAPQAIFVAGGAPWISIQKGCPTLCVKQTLVFDPATLVRSAILPGGVIDVTTSGTTAYALFDLPSETRAYDIRDPLHPSVTASRPSEASASSIAFYNGFVHVLGSRLYSYNASGLALTNTQLASEPVNSSSRLVIVNGCAFLTGRGGTVQRFVVGTGAWAPSSSPGTTGAPRGLTASGGRFFVLTDYALEIWSAGAAPSTSRRRTTRPF
jgi:hypothetical protein